MASRSARHAVLYALVGGEVGFRPDTVLSGITVEYCLLLDRNIQFRLMNVNYKEAARRHLNDGHILQNKQRLSNAGQLFGFSVECGLKAMLVACGINTDSDGSIPFKDTFRTHEPKLSNQITISGHLIPDGRYTKYFAMLGNVSSMSNWSIDHRYYAETAFPRDSVANWELVALETILMLEEMEQDGIL